MNKALKISLITLLMVVLVGSGIFVYKVLNRPDIYNGTKVQNIDMGSLSKSDAKERLEDRLQEELESREILIIGEGYENNVDYKTLGITYDYNKAIEEAYKVGRKGNVFTRFKDIYDTTFNGQNIDLEIIKNPEKIKQTTELVNQEVSKEKKDATIMLTGGKFIVTDEVVGKIVDVDILEKKLDASIDNFDSVEIPIKLDEPRATKELLNKVGEELGSYTTKFTQNDKNRVFNIQRSSNSIDNRLVLPGDTFSFNSTTGPRSLKAGYKEATVIMNGEFVPGEGGGVCQVSSTLYNTILNSGVSIVERHKHSKAIGYVPPGQDATVAYDVLDFKFKNNYKSPIYVKSSVNGGSLTIKLYGNKN